MAAISVRPGASPIQLPHVELTLEQVEIAGMRVRLGHAVPRRGATRGTAVILTGRAEFIEKYRETVSDLIGRGFAVAIFDWRGQGGSDRFPGHGQRGHVPRIEDYLDDLAAVLGRLERLRLPQPWLMLAHSMGGHVGLRQLARESVPIDDLAAILEAIATAPAPDGGHRGDTVAPLVEHLRDHGLGLMESCGMSHHHTQFRQGTCLAHQGEQFLGLFGTSKRRFGYAQSSRIGEGARLLPSRSHYRNQSTRPLTVGLHPGQPDHGRHNQCSSLDP